MSKVRKRSEERKAVPAGKPARKAARPRGAEISPEGPQRHPKFRRPPVIDPRRRAELVRTIRAAAEELFPSASWINLQADDADPFGRLVRSVKVKAFKAGREPTARAGTVGAACRAARKALWEDPRRDFPRSDPSPAELKAWFKRMSAEAMEKFRAGQWADALAYHAGAIPAGEFGPGDWLAFLDMIGDGANRRRVARQLRLLRDALAAAGLTIPSFAAGPKASRKGGAI